MNKKAQSGPVSFVFCVLFFFVFIGVAGGVLWSLFGLASTSAGLTGIEAFIYNNFAIITLFASILGTISYFYFGGGQ